MRRTKKTTPPRRRPSKGSVELGEAIDRRGHTQAKAGEELGCSEQHVCRLLSGERCASIKIAARAQEKYAVPAAAWAQFLPVSEEEAA